MKKQRVFRKENLVGVEYPTLLEKDGKTAKSVVCDLSRLTESVKFLGLAHGIGQKLGDAASGGTPAEKFEMASRIVENLYAGNWELTSEGDNGAEVIAAVCRVKKLKKLEIEKLQEELDALDSEKRDETIRAWRANPKVKAEIAAERARKAQKLAEESTEELEIELPE